MIDHSPDNRIVHNCPDDSRIYEPEEQEFLKAVDAWKKDTHCQFPTLSELFSILVSLGYRRVAEPMALPGERRSRFV